MEQDFLQHLAELRRCLIRAALAVMLGFALSLACSGEFLRLIMAQAGSLVFLRPAEALMARIKVALANGIVVSLPVTLWQAGRFLWPALYPRERRTLALYLPFGFLLFCAGLAFGYFIVARIGYRFLLSFASADLLANITIEKYLSFILSTTLICGVVFLLPVMVLMLVRVGILRASFLWRQQRKAIIGLALLVAVITPTVDAVSMALVFVPLFVLFELSVALSVLAERRAARRGRAGGPYPL